MLLVPKLLPVFTVPEGVRIDLEPVTESLLIGTLELPEAVKPGYPVSLTELGKISQGRKWPRN